MATPSNARTVALMDAPRTYDELAIGARFAELMTEAHAHVEAALAGGRKYHARHAMMLAQSAARLASATYERAEVADIVREALTVINGKAAR